jgi:hypothetical protein
VHARLTYPLAQPDFLACWNRGCEASIEPTLHESVWGKIPWRSASALSSETFIYIYCRFCGLSSTCAYFKKLPNSSLLSNIHCVGIKMTATDDVLSTLELLEAIFLFVPHRDLLISAFIVSRTWHNTIVSSRHLQERLFLSPAPPGTP